VKFLTLHFPDLCISMDSNRLRAVTGKKRALTRREVQLREQDVKDLYGAVDTEALSRNGRTLDYTDLVSSPSLWADRRDLLDIAESAGMKADEIEQFMQEPDSFLQQPVSLSVDELTNAAWIEHPIVSFALDRAWERFVERSIRSCGRTVAIVEIFDGSRIAHQERTSVEALPGLKQI